MKKNIYIYREREKAIKGYYQGKHMNIIGVKYYIYIGKNDGHSKMLLFFYLIIFIRVVLQLEPFSLT